MKVLYRRLGRLLSDSYHLQITNDTQEVTYSLAKPGKFWRISDLCEPYISVSSAIKLLECEMRERPEVSGAKPSEKQKLGIKQDIKILTTRCDNDRMRKEGAD